MRILIRWAISALSIAAAAWLLPGISVDPEAKAVIVFAVMAIVLGLMNAIVRPILALLSCGFIILTLGLFMLVINAATLWLSSYVAVNWLGIGFYVDGFWSAFFGSIIISVVSFLLSVFVNDKNDKNH